MPIPDSLRAFLDERDWGSLVSSQPVGGGCINSAARFETERGPLALLKTNPHAPGDMFAREAEGLRALRVPGGPRVPDVHGHGDDWILIEFLESAPRRADFAETLGVQLAALHNITSERFGFEHDNYIGSTPQPNPWTADGHEFFAQHRLRFQGELARKSGLLWGDELTRLEGVISRLPDLIPAQPASLIHGDLWGGNIMAGPRGEPVLIDPAAHYGWAEAELAMTTLFGRLPPAAYRAYTDVRPLAAGYEERFELYNLYHLLNHLNLFGRGYHGQVTTVLRRYA